MISVREIRSLGPSTLVTNLVADNIDSDDILVAHIIDTGFKVLNRFQSSGPVSKCALALFSPVSLCQRHRRHFLLLFLLYSVQ
jgi:hypothetical protein